ncbi:MAG: transglutaminase domain-containing protein, partial [Oscillospiraceae bacterium]
MNGTMRKRIVSGLVALGMLLSPTGTGLGTLSAFAEDGASSGTVSGETDPTGGETDPDDGETGSEDGETGSEDSEEGSEDGETGSEDSEEGSEDGETGSEEGEEDSEDKTTSYEERFDLSDNSVLYTDTDLSALTETLTGDVIPYYGIHILNEWPEESNNVYNAINAYKPSIYASSDGYNALTSTEKKLYEAMYARAVAIDTSTENGTEDIPVQYYNEDGELVTEYVPGFIDSNGNGRVTFSVSGATYENYKRALSALGYDNPQFFWLGHGSLYSSNSSGIIGMTFLVDEKLTEYLNGSKRQSTKSEIFEVVDKVIEGASIYANEYSKEWYIHDYLCNNTIYDPDLHKAGESPYDHDITGLLLHGVCVCESYAKCSQLFFNALGIENLYIVGCAEKGDPTTGHAWNQICLDDEWYNFDSTWDDLAPEYQQSFDGAQYYYRYFNVTDNNFLSDHYAFDGYTEVYSPEICTATKYSYDNHGDNFQVGDSNFLVSGNGKTKSAVSVEEALSYISRSNNSKADYVITYTGEVIEDELADVTVSSAVTVGAAKSVTFAGPASYTFSGGLTANCDVIFEAEATLGGNVTSASKTITVKNPGSDGNTVYFAENAVVSIKALNFEGSFANVVDGGAKSINITAVTSTADSYNNGNNKFFIMSGNAVIGTITNTGAFDLCIEQNANVSVTGAVTSKGGEKVNLIPVVEKDGYFIYTEIANGTTLLNAKTAAATCFKSAFTIVGEEEDTDYNYAIYKDGTAIKATLPRVYAYYGEEADYYGAYALFDEAVTAINGDKSLSGVPVTIVITDNVETAKFALPTKVKSVTVTSTSGQSITVKDAASVSVGVDLVLVNVMINTTNAKGYTLTTSKNLTLNEFSSKNLNALKGGTKSELTLDSMFGGCNITGFGTMTVNAGFDAGSPITVNVGSL